eukprot:Pompholyxophrys_punicea_v1_NODE_549_length_1706_cov_2.385827.p2 type:complete len:209 gc:universal NODE_549_length_1706_cov_2.385827:1013-1639(+)
MLKHMIDHVRKFGPFWTLSCFSFEDMNGFLVSTVTGTRGVAMQIIYGSIMLKRVDDVVSQISENLSLKVQELLSRLGCNEVVHAAQRKSWKIVNEASGLFTVSTSAQLELPLIRDFIEEFLGDTNYQFFKRIAIRESLFHSYLSDDKGVSQSFTVRYLTDTPTEKVGDVVCYIATAENVFALVMPHTPLSYSLLRNYRKYDPRCNCTK